MIIESLTIPPLWEVTQQNKPAPLQGCLNALEFLTKNDDWIAKNKETAQCYFQRLEETDLADSPASDKAMVLYKKLFASHPALFPKVPSEKWTKVIAGEKQVDIPRNLLSLESQKFQTNFGGKFEVKESMEIDVHEFPQESASSFLDYLSGKEITLTQDNVLSLLSLANEHQVSELIKQCLHYIQENLDWSNLPTLVDFAANEMNELFSLILCFAYQHRMDSELKNLMENHDFHSKGKLFLSYATLLPENNIFPYISENGLKIDMTPQCFDRYPPISKEALELLEEIRQHLIIADLVFPGDFQLIPTSILSSLKSLDMNFGIYMIGLRNLAKLCPNLQELIVCGYGLNLNDVQELHQLFPKLKGFGNHWSSHESQDNILDFIEWFGKESRPVLRALHLDGRRVKIDDNFLMQIAPKLKDLNHFSISWGTITILPDFVNSLQTLYCDSCFKLKIIFAPVATRLRFEFTSKLTSITAPQASVIECYSCNSLRNINASQVVNLHYHNCPQLGFITTEKAENILSRFCESFPHISRQINFL